MKKIGLLTTGFVMIGSLTFGLSCFNDNNIQTLNRGDGGSPQRPDLAYTHGETWSPADNKGDTGGIISNKSVKDPGGHIVSNEADGNTGIIAQA